jgi:hypothetical protein
MTRHLLKGCFRASGSKIFHFTLRPILLEAQSSETIETGSRSSFLAEINDSVSSFRIQASNKSTCTLHKSSEVAFQWSETSILHASPHRSTVHALLLDQRPTVTSIYNASGNSKPPLHKTSGVVSLWTSIYYGTHLLHG